MRRLIPAAVAIACVSGTSAHADDYHAEIMVEVVRPCAVFISRHHPIYEGMDEGQAVEVILTLEYEKYERMIAALVAVVRDKPQKHRSGIYRYALFGCLERSRARLEERR